MPDLTEAAERVLQARGPDTTNDDFKAAYNVSGDDSLGEAFRQLEDDERLLAKAYAAEMDPTLIDEEWLRENCEEANVSLSGGFIDYYFCAKTLVVRLVTDDRLLLFTMANYPLGRMRPMRNPTRGLVRTLMRIGGGM